MKERSTAPKAYEVLVRGTVPDELEIGPRVQVRRGLAAGGNGPAPRRPCPFREGNASGLRQVFRLRVPSARLPIGPRRGGRRGGEPTVAE